VVPTDQEGFDVEAIAAHANYVLDSRQPVQGERVEPL
jgi:hypothetical protein